MNPRNIILIPRCICPLSPSACESTAGLTSIRQKTEFHNPVNVDWEIVILRRRFYEIYSFKKVDFAECLVVKEFI